MLAQHTIGHAIVFVGDSHCLQWGPLLEELAVQYDSPAAFLCQDADKLRSPTDLLHSYLELWQPQLMVFMFAHH